MGKNEIIMVLALSLAVSLERERDMMGSGREEEKESMVVGQGYNFIDSDVQLPRDRKPSGRERQTLWFEMEFAHLLH